MQFAPAYKINKLYPVLFKSIFMILFSPQRTEDAKSIAEETLCGELHFSFLCAKKHFQTASQAFGSS